MLQGLTKKEEQQLSYFYAGGKTPFDGCDICYSHTARAGIALERKNGRCTAELGDERLFGRSLTLLEEKLALGGDFCVSETPAYRDLGMMLDCSRGAVPHFATFQKLVIKLARMGYTVLQLYMEDTYELKEYPYFGRHRGRYTAEQLREMDGFAAQFGIEVVPAIQTLAHLGPTLKWEAFSELLDVGDILLIDDDRTYAFIDSMFATLSACFAGRRINLGMDEAHMVGLGKYLDRHGYQNRMELMLRHFGRVHELAHKHGLKPMLWSDMFFRLATGGDYYAEDCTIDPAIAKALPADTSLVYWDYYSEEKAVYDRMLDKHRQMTDNLIFAGGAWKWMGFCPNNRFSLKVADLAHQSCTEHGVREVLITAWGDNGAECPLFAVLPALQYWAELCYGGRPDASALERRFAIACGGSFEQFLLLDEPSFTPDNPSPGRCSVNPAKYLFYQDVLCGMFDAHVDADRCAAHFARCAERLRQAGGACAEEWRYLFETEQALCETLALKCRAGLDIRKAYEQNDRAALQEYRAVLLPLLKVRTAAFTKAFHAQWLCENKPAGLDIFDLRVGGLEKRIDTAIERIAAYLEGETPRLEELEEPLLPFDGKESAPRDISVPFWHNIAANYGIASI